MRVLCARYRFLGDLRAHFGDDLRYVVRHLPHHPHGPIAARASEAASNQGMFWPWLDFVFTRQHALERGI